MSSLVYLQINEQYSNNNSTSLNNNSRLIIIHKHTHTHNIIHSYINVHTKQYVVYLIVSKNYVEINYDNSKFMEKEGW